ncbi:MAG: IPExxxVDY family protein [Bacteroidetes bacterium]|nr:IPExxxVDY family protein [Bacteroidota bacterium]MBL6944100.1 IPExxxVDY family protein [Bacteroidales bacterium]
MPKKLSRDIDYFEDYHMLAIVSHLKDYTLCYHININLNIDLIKYEDLIFAPPLVGENSFSWYYFHDKINGAIYYLIGNKGESGNLVQSQNIADYFLLIKSTASKELIMSVTGRLRKTPNISAVFGINMQQTRDMDLLIETNELHELEYIKRRNDNNKFL